MHEHDLDLLAAYADGTASPEEAALAARAIAGCAECSHEHAKQVDVLEVLRSAPPVLMTDLERATMRRSLADALPTPRVGWLTRYAPRVAAVAAGFAVVGLASVAMLGQFGGGDAADTAALDTVAATENQVGAERDVAEAPAADEGFLQSAGEAATEESLASGADSDDMADAPETTRAATTPFEPVELTSADLEDLAALDVRDDIAGQYTVVVDLLVEACSEQLPDPPDLEVAAEILFAGEPAYVIVYTSADQTIAAALSKSDCETLAEAIAGP